MALDHKKIPATYTPIQMVDSLTESPQGAIVFTDDDLALVREVRPDVVYISNHGGRVETRIGSTADFLAANASELKKYCGQIWVDGGIRTRQDVQTALYYGADQVIAARPLIRATFDDCYDDAVKTLIIHQNF